MNNLDKYWDKIHLKYTSTYDNWFNKYIHLLNKSDKIIELGCGRAYTSLYLLNNGFSDVTACDFSTEVINILNTEHKELNTSVFDISEKLPFKDDEINVIIADLCLHYFDSKKTKEILNEIYRVLKSGGYLIGRVNSANDKYHIPLSAKVLEKNFYYDGEIYKKFFEGKEFKELFENFKILSLEEKHMDRYEKPKTLWEFCIKKQ
jgi:ubiquinone/menaquinone biosynthesis C-methylase UbiE